MLVENKVKSFIAALSFAISSDFDDNDVMLAALFGSIFYLSARLLINQSSQ